MMQVDCLSAVMTAYENDSSSFRETFGNIFDRNLMTESLNSESILLRLASARAIGVILRLQPDPTEMYDEVIGWNLVVRSRTLPGRHIGFHTTPFSSCAATSVSFATDSTTPHLAECRRILSLVA